MDSEHDFKETTTGKAGRDDPIVPGMDGAPNKQYKNKFVQVCSFILVMEACERLAYYSTTTNLTIYLQKHLGFSPSKSSVLASLFSAMVYLTPILGAYVADTYLGRYKTIMYFSALYIVGMYLVAVAAIPSITSTTLFMIALFGFICVGAGGIKSNVSALGADQYDPATEAKELASFFNWFYWSVNVGSLLASVYFADLAVNGSKLIPEEDAFMAVYFIAAGVFTVALIAFVLGRNRYVRKPSDGSALAKFARITWFASKSSRHGQMLLLSLGLFALGEVINVILVFVDGTGGKVLAYVNGVVLMVAVALSIIFGRNVEWIYAATSGNGGEWTEAEVEGVWEMLRLSPYVAFQVSFWNVYSFMSGPWINQGCQMDCQVWPWQSGDDQYNPGSWAMWNNIGILAIVPVVDFVVYPWIGKMQGTAGPTPLQRIGTGYVFVILCMISAAIVEIVRRGRPLMKLNSVCVEATTEKFVSDMSLWWQLPQYFLLGVAEVFSSIAAYDLFYSEVPDNMKSTAQSIQLLCVALGGAANTMLQNIFVAMGELPDNLNDGHAEYLYFTAAVMALAFLIVFIFVSRSFTYKSSVDDNLEDAGPRRVSSYRARSSFA